MPPSEASAAISPSTVTTDMTGGAAASATANAMAGSYTVAANVEGVATPAEFSLTNTNDVGDAVLADGFD